MWFKKVTLLIFVVLSSFFAAADEKVKQLKPPPEPINVEVVTQLLVGLFVVICCIVASAWLFKRFGGVRYQGSQIKVITALPLGGKDRILLLQLGDHKQVLLGVSGSGINTLAQFDEPVIKLSSDNVPFASRLKEAMKGESQ